MDQVPVHPADQPEPDQLTMSKNIHINFTSTTDQSHFTCYRLWRQANFSIIHIDEARICLSHLPVGHWFYWSAASFEFVHRYKCEDNPMSQFIRLLVPSDRNKLNGKQSIRGTVKELELTCWTS